MLFLNFYLRSLDFSYNDFGDEGVVYLGCVFKINKKFEYIGLNWNNIRVFGIEELVNGFVMNKKLRDFDLFWNCFLDEGVSYFSFVLIFNCSFKVLEM